MIWYDSRDLVLSIHEKNQTSKISCYFPIKWMNHVKRSLKCIENKKINQKRGDARLFHKRQKNRQ